MTTTNLDYYRFEYYSQSYSPLGRIKQDKLYHSVLVVEGVSDLTQQGVEF